MKCLHCLVDFHHEPTVRYVGHDADGSWEVISVTCSNCRRDTYSLRSYHAEPGKAKKVLSEQIIRPKVSGRPPVPNEVPQEFADDYREACLVIMDSPKASAALSRRCLQSIIRGKLNIKEKTLDMEIKKVVDGGLVSADLMESIDAIRNIGNFAAHPIKSISSGEIVAVEPHEAEWNLEVLEMMFDELFVRPAIIQRKRAALNAKLGDAGKPTMK